MHVAAVQLDIRWEDRPANHARVRELLAEAAVPAGAMVVLPEMFDTGFSMNTARTDPGEPSSSEAFCRTLAAQHNVCVLAGVVARTGEGQWANEAVAFAPDGRELARYRKMRPFTGASEHRHYLAGGAHAVFEWQGTRVAPFVCYDLRFPELFRPAVRDGAELIVVVANWPQPRSEHWVRLLQARAIENMAYALGVNRCGRDPTLAYDGRSSLFDPMGREVFEADDREQVVVRQVDPQAVRQWRQEFPALRDMIPG